MFSLNQWEVGSIMNLVDYLYEDEKTNWEELGKPEGHIFNDIQRLSEFLAKAYNPNA